MAVDGQGHLGVAAGRSVNVVAPAGPHVDPAAILQDLAQPLAADRVVCRACSTAWGCKSPTQPDGGEVLAKRQGVAARRGLKEAWSKAAT
jgi:hypothetical protein